MTELQQLQSQAVLIDSNNNNNVNNGDQLSQFKSSTYNYNDNNSNDKIIYTPEELIALENHAVLPNDSVLPERSFYRLDANSLSRMNNYIQNMNHTHGKRNNNKRGNNNNNNNNNNNSRLKDHFRNHHYNNYYHGDDEDNDETPEWMTETDFKVDPDFQLYMKSGSHTTDDFEREKKIFHSKSNSGITKISHSQENESSTDSSKYKNDYNEIIDNNNDNNNNDNNNNNANEELKKELQKQLEEPEILGPTEQEYYQQLAEKERQKEQENKKIEEPTVQTNAGDFQFGLELESKKEKDSNFLNYLLNKKKEENNKDASDEISPVLPVPGTPTAQNLQNSSINRSTTILPPGMIPPNLSQRISSSDSNNIISQIPSKLDLQQMEQIQKLQQIQQIQRLQQQQQLQGGNNSIQTAQNIPNTPQSITQNMPQNMKNNMKHTNLNQIPPHILQELINSQQHSPQLPPGMQHPLTSLNHNNMNRSNANDGNVISSGSSPIPNESLRGALQGSLVQQNQNIPLQLQNIQNLQKSNQMQSPIVQSQHQPQLHSQSQQLQQPPQSQLPQTSQHFKNMSQMQQMHQMQQMQQMQQMHQIQQIPQIPQMPQMQNIPQLQQMQNLQQIQKMQQLQQLQQMQQMQQINQQTPQTPQTPQMPTNLPPPDQLPPPYREKFFQIQQALLHYQKLGQQPPPILLHDMMTFHNMLQNTFRNQQPLSNPNNSISSSNSSSTSTQASS